MTVVGGVSMIVISLLPVLLPAAATSIVRARQRRRGRHDNSDEDS
ncbi:hypothetical protein [Mycobacterium sp. 155]|nr:hypothetical protein [Mycobacterium sp. 155]